MITEEPKLFPRRYEVHFKSSTGVYLCDDDLEIGDFVAVQCGKGYNVGAISQEIPPDVEVPLKESTKHQKILNKLTDDKAAIEQMLSNKILAENNALTLCRTFCQSHKIGTSIDAISAEFQFDRKKLTIYVMKSGDTSVCKLVRKLFDTFKMRISILDIESVDAARQLAIRYLELTKLNLTLDEVFIDPSTFVAPQNMSAKSGNRRSGSLRAHSNANPSLLSALQDYKPHSTLLTQSSPPSVYPEMAEYRPYQPYNQFHYPVASALPRSSNRQDQQHYAYPYAYNNVNNPTIPNIPIYRPMGYSREENYSSSNALPSRRMGHEYVSREDRYFAAKALPDEDYSHQSFQDSYYDSGLYPSDHLPLEDLDKFDEAFDTSLRQLMISSHGKTEGHVTGNSQPHTSPEIVSQSSQSFNPFLPPSTSSYSHL